MPEFCLNIANLNIEIVSVYEEAKTFCREYLTEAVPDMSFTISEADIDFEIELADYPVSRPMAETTAVYRKIAEQLPFYNACVFHGAAISYENNGYIFTAPSGTGKTTHIMLWKQYLGEKVQVVNGDKPVLQIKENGVEIFSTPYAGKEGLENHSTAPLKAICLVQQAKENRLQRVNGMPSIVQLMKQMYKPYDAAAAQKTLELLDLLVRQIPIYLLECDMSEQAVKCSFEGLTGLNFEERRRDL